MVKFVFMHPNHHTAFYARSKFSGSYHAVVHDGVHIHVSLSNYLVHENPPPLT